MNLNNLNFAGQREWDHRFPYLKKTGLDHPYIMILGLAKSKREIEHFHNLLDSNCRVLRNDLIDLENFWEKFVKPDITPQTWFPKLSDDSIQWLLKQQSRDIWYKVVRYYDDYLTLKKEALTEYLNHDLWFDNHLILSFPERAGHGSTHFYVEIFKTMLGIDCYLSKDKQKLIIKLITTQYMLNEKLTFKLGQLPPYRMTTSSAGPGGREIDFSYCFDASADFLDFLLEEPKPTKTAENYIVRDCHIFSEHLEKILRQHSIPITSEITPLKGDDHFVRNYTKLK